MKHARIALMFVFIFMLSGCSVAVYNGLKSDRRQIASLASEVERLRALKEKDDQELDRARKELEEKLKGQEGVSVSQDERGLVVTFVSEVLFDSGKAELKSETKHLIKSVSDTIQEEQGRNIGIEGHTDNVPIKLSKWKSNWELSTARAVSVLHYLESCGIAPSRMRATGFGEYHPVATNDSADGRKKNRRVEIILLPKLTPQELQTLKEAENNLK
jgi:chemotaxis protein MotB